MSSSFATGLGRSYSITSSARARSEGGTSRPSALAAFRLTTSSYLVDPNGIYKLRGECCPKREKASNGHPALRERRV
jgi:hypothetical protein